MEGIDLICMWIAELVPLCATLFSFIYGINKFFKKGKPLFLQSITMAMGSHALGSIYHVCQTLTTDRHILVELDSSFSSLSQATVRWIESLMTARRSSVLRDSLLCQLRCARYCSICPTDLWRIFRLLRRSRYCSFGFLLSSAYITTLNTLLFLAGFQ